MVAHGYRFTSHDGEVDWHPRPEAAEGRDASGSDKGSTPLTGENPPPLTEACRSRARRPARSCLGGASGEPTRPRSRCTPYRPGRLPACISSGVANPSGEVRGPGADARCQHEGRPGKGLPFERHPTVVRVSRRSPPRACGACRRCASAPADEPPRLRPRAGPRESSRRRCDGARLQVYRAPPVWTTQPEASVDEPPREGGVRQL